ncbi:MAG: hypothetical protein NUW00_05225 [Candidatus Kaiserbacteria bacterium]|nr:hypothetical protein [Candidatus Kaiserbacteria bacterium]
MRTYEPSTGEDLPTTAKRMIDVAKTRGDLVRARFGSIDLLALSTSEPEEVIAQFNRQTHDSPTKK